MLLRCSLTAALSCVGAALLMAEGPVAFTVVQSPTAQASMNMIAVDLNNDGVPDLVQTSLYNEPCNVTVSMGKGDGTFGPPNTFSLGSTLASNCPAAAADINGDGNADLVFAIPGSNTIIVMLGNGDGTFQPAITSTADIPSGDDFIDTISAADFNHDGKADLIVQYEDPSANYQDYVMLMPGDGSGSFSSGRVIFTPEPAGSAADGVSPGDFDADDNADLAFVASGAVHVLYGDGKLGFADTVAITGSFNISAGDLNSDGRTDLYGVDESTHQLVTLYAQQNRTFAAYFSSLPAGASLGAISPCCDSILTMADFNGDGRMDLVGELNQGYPNTTQKLAFFLAGTNPGEFTTQVVNMPSHLWATNAVVGNFNRDAKPDVVLAMSDTSSSQSEASAATLVAAINATPGVGLWSNCNYPPRAQGIALCAPIAYAPSTVSFAATASTIDPLRKIELWVDGKKIGQRDNTWEHQGWFNWSSAFASGTHNATLFASTIDNQQQRLDFAFKVGPSPCAAPSAEGVHICKPVAGTTSSPVLVQAAATIAGPLDRMELWVDGTKKYTETTSTWFTASVYTQPGNHRFDVIAFDEAGAQWVSTAYASTGP
jgi:VCBS repeat protein/Big-like domain-containing protein